MFVCLFVFIFRNLSISKWKNTHSCWYFWCFCWCRCSMVRCRIWLHFILIQKLFLTLLFIWLALLKWILVEMFHVPCYIHCDCHIFRFSHEYNHSIASGYFPIITTYENWEYSLCLSLLFFACRGKYIWCMHNGKRNTRLYGII